mgnify:CR=1 FL=1|tara:strand:- start:73 stop:1299 length:1227 start_codon:yes stop_codon:yes gene_type:complete
MTENEFREKRRFISRLISDLHQYGTSTHALEGMVEEVAAFFYLEVALIATPTSVNFTLRSYDKEYEYTNCLRLLPKSPNLGSLADVHTTIRQVVQYKLTLKEANYALDEINISEHRYSLWIRALAFAAAGAGFAMLTKSTLADVVCSAALGVIVFLVSWVAEHQNRIADMFEPLITLSASLIASFIQSLGLFALNVELVVLSSVIIFIPGLSLTVGFNELAKRHLVSGTAKVMDAMMSMFKLYFGGFLGLAISQHLWSVADAPLSPVLPEWTVWFAVAILCGALVVVFNNRLRDAFFAILAGFIAYGVNVLVSMYFDNLLGVFAGAFALGLYCNAFSWFANAPASLLVLHGLVVLVPGSKIFIALDNLITTDEILHVDQLGSQTFLIIMSLIAGFIFSNVCLPQKNSL